MGLVHRWWDAGLLVCPVASLTLRLTPFLWVRAGEGLPGCGHVANLTLGTRHQSDGDSWERPSHVHS